MAVDFGIDLGTATTLICNTDGEVLLNEPSLVIKSNTNGQIVAIGEEASEMLGRTPEGVAEVAPIRGGAITGFNATVSMLKQFMKRVNRGTFGGVRAVIAVPCGISDVERRAVHEAAHNAGIKSVALMDAPLAAAAGCGVDVGAPHGSMVVNIGAGICEAAVVSLGGIVESHSIRTAGTSFDNAIAQYVKKQYSVAIGDSTAEGIKISIGSVYSGIDRGCLSEPAEAIVDAVRVTLEKTPPELAADIIESGIVLTGGGAMLRGLGRLININTEIPVYIAENPIECVAIGAARAAEFMLNEKGKGIFGR